MEALLVEWLAPFLTMEECLPEALLLSPTAPGASS